MMGGYGGGYGGGMGGYGSPFGGGMGGYGTQFGGYDMGGGGGFGGYGGGMRAPAYQPTINDAFSNYFSQQYYGGPAFNPFAATSMFGGGGYGGGFGGGGRRGGRRGGGRQLRQMFEDYFQPEGTPLAQPTPQPQPPQMAPGFGSAPPSPVYGGGQVEMGPQQFRPDVMPQQPYMGGFDSIMPVQQQDTPVQSVPMAPAFYEPPMMAPYAPSPFESPFSRPGRDMFMGDYGFGMR